MFTKENQYQWPGDPPAPWPPVRRRTVIKAPRDAVLCRKTDSLLALAPVFSGVLAKARPLRDQLSHDFGAVAEWHGLDLIGTEGI
jgi:hypothetical protein